MDKEPVLKRESLVSFAMALLWCISSSAQTVDGDEDTQPAATHASLLKVVHTYFRSDPYSNGFGVFLRHLINDPTLTDKVMHKRTDSSLFYFQGAYRGYSPYSFLASKTEIRLAEQPFVSENGLAADTLFVYQLLGYSTASSANADVRSEFQKFTRRFGKQFTMQSHDIMDGGEIAGTIEDCFIPGVTGSPLSVSWVRLNPSEYAFIVTIRLKVRS